MDDYQAFGCAAHSRSTVLLSCQSPVVFWLTGVSGAGKTTIATSFECVCRSENWPAVTLDGDAIRSRLNSDLGFSEQDRAENIRRIAEVAALMADAQLVVIVSCISPLISFRDMARNIIGNERFIEVYIDTPLDVAEERDPKGLYQRARAGKIQLFTGVHARYEAPINPQIRIDTTTTDIDAATDILRRYYIDSLARSTAHEPGAVSCSLQPSLDTATSE